MVGVRERESAHAFAHRVGIDGTEAGVDVQGALPLGVCLVGVTGHGMSCGESVECRGFTVSVLPVFRQMTTAC
jgi:hypothetical protein